MTPVRASVHGIESALPFVPDSITALAHAPCWAQLGDEQRLRYNQIYGLSLNEHAIFFERSFTRNVLGPFLDGGFAPDLAASLARVIEEEDRHAEMFARLNRELAPGLYAATDARFVRVPHGIGSVLRGMTRRPRLFPLFLWLGVLQEERALHYGRLIEARAASLEPRFAATHVRHLHDEDGHVPANAELLDRLWQATPRWLRRLNARLLAYALREFFGAPKRAGIRVVRAWAEELPELRRALPAIERELLDLGASDAFQRALYSRESVPGVFARFDRWPELACLARSIRGYVPSAGAA